MKKITIKNNTQDVVEAIQLIEANYPEFTVKGLVCEGNDLILEADAQATAQPDQKKVGLIKKLLQGLVDNLNKIKDPNILVKTLRVIATSDDAADALSKVTAVKKEVDAKEAQAAKAAEAQPQANTQQGEETPAQPETTASESKIKEIRNAAIDMIGECGGIMTKEDLVCELLYKYPDASKEEILNGGTQAFRAWHIEESSTQIDEGLWDRAVAKAKAWGMAGKAVAQNVGNKMAGNKDAQHQSVFGAMQTGKFGQLIKQYINKIQNLSAKIQKYATDTQDQDERAKADEMVKQMNEFVRAASDALKQEQEELKKAGYDRKGQDQKAQDGQDNAGDQGDEKKEDKPADDKANSGSDEPKDDQTNEKKPDTGTDKPEDKANKDGGNGSDPENKTNESDGDEDFGHITFDLELNGDEENEELVSKIQAELENILGFKVSDFEWDETDRTVGGDGTSASFDCYDIKKFIVPNVVYHITDIEWDTSDEEGVAHDPESSHLPRELYLGSDEDMDDEDIADWLSDKYGYVVYTFDYDSVDPNEVDSELINEGFFQNAGQFLKGVGKGIAQTVKKGAQDAWDTAKGAAGEIDAKLKDRAANYAAGKGFTATVNTATFAKDLSEIIGELEADLKDCGWSEKRNPQLAKVLNGLETTMDKIHGQGAKGTMSNLAKIRHGAGKLAGTMIAGAVQGAILGGLTGWMRRFMSPRAHAALVAASVVLLRAVLKNLANRDINLDKKEEEEAQKALNAAQPEQPTEGQPAEGQPQEQPQPTA